MTDIVEKTIKAGDLPPQLRGDIEADAAVLVSVRRLTVNGFTEEFEQRVLKAEKSGLIGPMDAKEALAQLRKIADEDKLH